MEIKFIQFTGNELRFLETKFTILHAIESSRVKLSSSVSDSFS